MTYVDSTRMPKGIYARRWLLGHTYELKEIECPECKTKIQAKRKDTLCKPCKNIRLKTHWAYTEQIRDPAKKRDGVLRRNFGISLEEYKKLSKQQDDKCLICKKQTSVCGRALDVDHNHLTGRIRGLLCNQCNQALGLFKDNIESLRNAIKYLEQENE